jgi:molybdopterin synthase catalytic subunit
LRKIGVHRKGTIELSDILQTAKAKTDFNEAGAIALFIGVTRGKAENQEVKKLKLEAYEEKADEVLQTICNDLKQKNGIVDVQIHHLLGEFQVSEDLVYVLVAGIHRSEVFSTLREAVERFKEQTPIFKKEYITDKNGNPKSYWIGEQANHHSRENPN